MLLAVTSIHTNHHAEETTNAAYIITNIKDLLYDRVLKWHDNLISNDKLNFNFLTSGTGLLWGWERYINKAVIINMLSTLV